MKVYSFITADAEHKRLFSCSLQASEIRRVNNLYTDQHFFALKVVKIPVREHGVLTEPQQLEKCRQNTVVERVPVIAMGQVGFGQRGGVVSFPDLILGGRGGLPHSQTSYVATY